MKSGLSAIERFLTHTKKSDNGCLLWQASLNSRGYGQFGISVNSRWKLVLAHRWYFQEIKGRIPEGLVLDHLCRTPRCVNPDHLEIVTQKENNLRGIGPGALNAKKTHCPKGHEYSEENTYFRRNKNRACKTCHHERQAKYRKTRMEGHIYRNRGELHRCAKLTINEVNKIRELSSEAKYSQRKLGEMFNVSHSVIFNILKGRTWTV